MNIVIMGCGRVGARLAGSLDAEGHSVTIIDAEPRAFEWLDPSYGGGRLVGNGMDLDTQERAGVRNADVFISCTRGDNRNVMAAQIAKHIFGVRRVVSRIFDPIRAEMYRELGLQTISPTTETARLLLAEVRREE